MNVKTRWLYFKRPLEAAHASQTPPFRSAACVSPCSSNQIITLHFPQKSLWWSKSCSNTIKIHDQIKDQPHSDFKKSKTNDRYSTCPDQQLIPITNLSYDLHNYDSTCFTWSSAFGVHSQWDWRFLTCWASGAWYRFSLPYPSTGAYECSSVHNKHKTNRECEGH